MAEHLEARKEVVAATSSPGVNGEIETQVKELQTLAEMREEAWKVDRTATAHVAAQAQGPWERRMEQLETWIACYVVDIEARTERWKSLKRTLNA